MHPSMSQIHDILFDETSCKTFLLNNNVFFYSGLQCPSCGSDTERSIERWSFGCRKKTCSKEVSISKDTFFENCRLKVKMLTKMHSIMLLAYFWINEVHWSAAVHMTGFAKQTVSRFYYLFRRLAASALSEIDTIIGGEGVIVEIDETKLGRRKYNRGHRVDGVWVIVGIERSPQRRVFMVAVKDRSAETIREIIRTHVAPGSIVHTDGWRGYVGIDTACSIVHRTINHSEGFIDIETGVHTNTVEGTNFAVKRRIPVRSRVRDGIEDHSSEFIWRRQNEGCIWESFVRAMREIVSEND